MRIVFIQDYLRSGGTEAQTIHHALAAARAGNATVLLTFRPGGPLVSSLARHLRDEPGLSFRWESLQPWDSGLAHFAPGLVRKLRELEPGRVVLLGRNANAKGALLRQKLGSVPVIATVRTGRALPSSYRKCLVAADKILVNSEFARTRAKEAGARPERIERVYNPLLLQPAANRDPAAQAERRTALNLPPETRVMLTVAALRPGKSHESFLAALAEIDPPPGNLDWQWWIVGAGPRQKYLRDAVAASPHRDRIRLFGYQPDPRPLLATADLFVLPSLEESLPNAIIEAQACGLAALAFDVAGLGECIENKESGQLVPRGDFQSLASAALKLLADDETRNQMAEAAVPFALKRFDPESRTQEFLEHITELG